MLKEKEIIYTTSECLEQTVNILKELGNKYDWNDNKEFINHLFMLSTIGYVITHNEFKDELIKMFLKVGKKIKHNQDIIKEAKRYAESSKK
mgnify:CR=1 FL=1|tara:strand:- start:243 stop:515 length:273 start_codon:yes stop_codon:yes gene_type:complete